MASNANRPAPAAAQGLSAYLPSRESTSAPAVAQGVGTQLLSCQSSS